MREKSAAMRSHGLLAIKAASRLLGRPLLERRHQRMREKSQRHTQTVFRCHQYSANSWRRTSLPTTQPSPRAKKKSAATHSHGFAGAHAVPKRSHQHVRKGPAAIHSYRFAGLMQSQNAAPKAITYIATIRACEKGQHPYTAMYLLAPAGAGHRAALPGAGGRCRLPRVPVPAAGCRCRVPDVGCRGAKLRKIRFGEPHTLQAKRRKANQEKMHSREHISGPDFWAVKKFFRYVFRLLFLGPCY